MKSSDRRRNNIKNLVIVCLTISMIFLTFESGLLKNAYPTGRIAAFTAYIKELWGGSPSAVEPDKSIYAQAASPRFMAVSAAGAGHYGIKYSGEELALAYGRFSTFLGEALGSAGAPVRITEKEWREILVGNGVYFDFLYAQPLAVLAGWLGTDMPADTGDAARRFCLAPDGDAAALYYIRAEDNVFFKCETALSFSSVAAGMEDFSFLESTAAFAFEAGESHHLVDPYMLILDEAFSVNELSVKNPLHHSLSVESVLELFGMNSFVALPYSEPDGTVVYVEGTRTLRINTDGNVVFRQTGAEALVFESGGELSAGEAVDAAYAFALAGIGESCGAASVSLSGVSFNPADNSYVIRFAYSADAIPIHIVGYGGALEMHIRDGFVTWASLVFREYTAEGEIYPLPEKQEAAVVQALGGGEPLLIYEDSGEEALPCWVIN